MIPVAVVTTTVATSEDADVIARALVSGKLAACVQITPIRSLYTWNGAVEEAAEWMLICKIRADDYADVESAIRAAHAYATPEIVATPVAGGYQPYLDWIVASTAR